MCPVKVFTYFFIYLSGIFIIFCYDNFHYSKFYSINSNFDYFVQFLIKIPV